MRLIFFVVALLVGTTAALEKDHLEKLKIATSELKLADHFEAEGINPANLDRVRRGFDPQCYNAELRAVQKCSFSIVDIIRTLTLNVDAEVNNVLCSNDSCYNAVLNYSQTCKFQVNIHFSIFIHSLCHYYYLDREESLKYTIYQNKNKNL